MGSGTSKEGRDASILMAEKYKKFFDLNGRHPSSRSKNTEEKELWLWSQNRKRDYKMGDIE